ncbi:MAG: hypothetical protein J3K34DRAFT_518935 [Monoraphidium minutum]|nr:MAG: hypothetical protein J3K34DRAFT_518935 [Monoraphidium minutum]
MLRGTGRLGQDAASPLLRPGGGASRFNFSSSASAFSRSQSAASGSLRAARPPAGPSAVTAQNVLVGFDAPPEARGAPASPSPPPAAAAPASPGRRGARPSLLSLAFSDLPSGAVPVGSQEPDLSPLDALATQQPVLARAEHRRGPVRCDGPGHWRVQAAASLRRQRGPRAAAPGGGAALIGLGPPARARGPPVLYPLSPSREGYIFRCSSFLLIKSIRTCMAGSMV